MSNRSKCTITFHCCLKVETLLEQCYYVGIWTATVFHWQNQGCLTNKDDFVASEMTLVTNSSFLTKVRATFFKVYQDKFPTDFSQIWRVQFFLLVMFQLILTSRSLLKLSCIVFTSNPPFKPYENIVFQVWLVCFSIYNIKD